VKAVDEVEGQRDGDERDDARRFVSIRSGVLHDDAFEDVGDVLAAIRWPARGNPGSPST
jgi:hypothetical protein